MGGKEAEGLSLDSFSRRVTTNKWAGGGTGGKYKEYKITVMADKLPGERAVFHGPE